MSFGAFAQTPYTFNYQSVVRDASGLLLVNKNVGVQITLLKGSASGTTTYQETFNINTNDFALINLQIGSGTVVSGNMNTIDWANGPYFMEVAMDFSGGNTYVTMGATQLVSVPYALHSKTAENTFSGDYNDLNNSPINVSYFNNDQGYLMTELDGDSTNEVQALSLSNDTIFLSNGGFVKLPVLSVGFNGQYANLLGAPTNVSFFTNDSGYLTSEMDGSITNEIQTMTFSNDSIHLTSGGNVDLSGYDNSAAIGVNAANIATNTTGISTNTTNISTNTGNISTNATGVSTNAASIATNATAISTNTTGIATNVSSINTNTTGIATNATGIGTNSSSISSNTSTIATNASNIATNTSGVATNSTAISSHITNDLDTDSTNEIQTLNLTGTTLSLSGANAVDLQDASVWDTNSVGAFYDKKVSIGGTPLTNRALTLHTDSLNSAGIIQYARSNQFNYIEFQNRTNGKRISVGMSDTGSYQGAFSIGTNSGSAWTDPIIVAMGAPTNSIRVNSNGNVGFGMANPENRIHAVGDSVVIAGYSNAQHTNNWRNAGVFGESNTTSNAGRGVVGHVIGANYGHAVRGEAETDMQNQGLSGIALSKPTNGNNQFGVYGEARKGWASTNSGTGTHWGGYFLSTGEGAFNVGASGVANTPGTGTNRGTAGLANSNTASDNFGTIGFAVGSIPGTNRGAYGQASNSTGTNYGVHGVATGTTGVNSTGVYGFTEGNTAYNTGVDGTAQSTGATNIGVGGYAYGTNTGANKNYGLYAYAQNADTNYGVYSTVTAANNVNYGVYSTVSGGTLNSYAMYGENTSTEGTANTDNHYGVRGIANGVNTNARNWGVSGLASGSGLQNTAVTGYTNGTATHSLGIQGTANGTGTNNYAVYGSAANGTNNYAGFFAGNVTITGNLNVTGSIAKGSGTFKIDHPIDPENKYLVHSFMESPDMMNVYSGNITTDAYGFATVDLPTYFEAANKDYRYQLTVIGSFAQAIIKQEIAGNKFVIQTNDPNIKVSWQVSGVRSDKYANAHRVIPELEKTKKGTYLHPTLYGKSEDKGENAEAKKLGTTDDKSTNNDGSSSSNTGEVEKQIILKKKAKQVKTNPQIESNTTQTTQHTKIKKVEKKPVVDTRR
tara:strand:+ start:9393 stop:12767 length:3375 start_codon:yes stop_codon:yes gene_type:complete